MRDFRTLKVWRKAHELTLEVYRVTRRFPDDERFGLTSQVRRACVSIESNIAEGSGRKSDADYLRFVHIASGSASEVECQLMIGRDLSYLADEIWHALDERVGEIKRMLHGLGRHLGDD